MEDLKLASFNVNGLNLPTKRRVIFDKIRKSKAQITLLQETHSTESSAPLWEAEWGGKIIFNHGLPNSRGVAILFERGLTPKILSEKRDENGRILALDLLWGANTLTLGCLYAPTQDRPLLQAQFMDSLDPILDALTSDDIVLGGDLNCIMDPALDKNSTSNISTSSCLHRNRLITLIEERQLCDLLRIRNPSKRVYTFRRGNYASRLDFFLVSDHLSEAASQVKILEGPHSDHSLISFQLHRSDAKVGPGYWRFDSSLLTQETFVQAMNKFFLEWQPPDELSDPNSRWEWLKFEIRNFVQKFVKEKRVGETKLLSDLQTELEDLYASVDQGIWVQPEHLDSVKREIKEIENERANKMIFHAKAKWARLGEKPTSYFLNLEKRSNKNKILSSVLTSKGESISDSASVLRHCKEFYQDLYQETPNDLPSTEDLESLFQEVDLPSLTEDEQAYLDSAFTRDELKRALENLNKNKCPGSDGLPPEFFCRFWELIAPYLHESLSFSIDEGLLSSEQRRGIITLIPKRMSTAVWWPTEGR